MNITNAELLSLLTQRATGLTQSDFDFWRCTYAAIVGDNAKAQWAQFKSLVAEIDRRLENSIYISEIDV